MSLLHVGVQVHPQHTTTSALRAAWRSADELGVDSLWTWDHFFPIFGDDLDGAHFEGWTLLAAMAADTRHATIGSLVTSVPFRNPDLLADMARTIDHLSDGRFVLGLGAGWFARDHEEYGFPFRAPGARVDAVAEAIDRVQRRLGLLEPAPKGPLPLLVGGTGPRMLDLVARRADVWNAFVQPEVYAERNAALDDACRTAGRDPAAIERSVLLPVKRVSQADEYVAAGATHLIVQCPHPFDMGPARTLLDLRGSG